MKVKFSANIYVTIWTGEVDKLISYDYKKHEWTVKKVTTGKIRTHMTPLEINNTSLSPKEYSKVEQKKIEKYLRALAIIRSNQSRLI
ncbi:hypothetical protein [Clostridium saccharoperbutylacetonicum]|uniref:hypothetical protein n=1 Tax=Clostridium saccharoperbutylacetonicum TaxID=36745 RepID=UPI0039E78E0B